MSLQTIQIHGHCELPEGETRDVIALAFQEKKNWKDAMQEKKHHKNFGARASALATFRTRAQSMDLEYRKRKEE